MKWQEYGPQGRTNQTSRGLSSLWPLMLIVVLAGVLLTACGGPDAASVAARASRLKFQQELTHAQTDLGVPTAMLAPVVAQQTSLGADASAARYDALYAQLLTVEQASIPTLRQKAQDDLQTLATAISQRRSQGFAEAATYQARLDQDLKAIADAQTAADLARIDSDATAQIQALQTMWPAYQKLQDFQSTIRSMRAAGVDATLSQALYDQDTSAFKQSGSGDHYSRLSDVIDGQLMTIMAEQTAALPFIGKSLLKDFQDKIDLLRRNGDTSSANAFQQQHDSIAKSIGQATQLADYLTLAQAINHQTSEMALPLARVQAKHDLDAFMALLATAQAKSIGGYPAAYEYADKERGYGDAANEVLSAKSLEDYRQGDQDITILATNLQAMLDNLNDTTPRTQAHQSDLRLLGSYGFMQGKAIIVSLREQVARLYENGNLVYTTDVTTGRLERPSIPGVHYAIYKQTHMVFSSPDPAGSPFYYAPTPINYGILYANYGFFLHDAYWRRKFGQGSNLPHYDPAAFNGGSHGCINFPESNMAYVYNWTPVGSPIIVY